ncbi:MAG: hypothetical protein KGN36_21635 [Acidobacteriota bacterium]|nr:hypothetical protein [Acidobacteriota bacterium]
MSRSLSFPLVFLTCAAVAGGAETAQQRGKRVVYEALEALGGRQFLAMEDRVESGRAYSFYRGEIQGLSIATIYTRYLVPTPGKVSVRERENFDKDQKYGVLFNESGAWEITYRGAQMLDQKRIDAFRDGTLRNVFYILRERLDEPGLDFFSQGADLWENRPVEIVDITDADNQTTTVYFSALDKLPVRQIFKRRNKEYKDFDTEETIFAKYRDLDGVKWPYSIRHYRNHEKIFEMYSDSVRINRDLTDDLFTLPVNIKILPAK